MSFLKTYTFRLAAMLFAAVLVTGCAQNGYGTGPSVSKETAGQVLGAVGGGVAGSQFGQGDGKLWATGAGTLIGAMLGGAVGASLDRADQAAAAQASQQAFNSGNRANWRNPNTGNYGYVAPGNAYDTANNATCRPMTQTYYVNGEKQTYSTTACQNPDGSWTTR